jgi:hypothetical protein
VTAILHFTQAPWLVEDLLEVEFQRHLENSRVSGRADLSKIAILKPSIGIPEIDIVERVVEFCPELIPDAFARLSSLQ